MDVAEVAGALQDEPHDTVNSILEGRWDGLSARPAGDDRTNDVYILEDGTGGDAVLKQYDPSPTERFFYLFGQWACGRSATSSLDQRIYEDARGKAVVERAGVAVPETLAITVPAALQEEQPWEQLDAPVSYCPDGTAAVLMERAPGAPAKEAAAEMDGTAVYRLSRRWGEAVQRVHTDGYRLFDLRWPNLLVDRSPQGPDAELHHVDTEFGFPGGCDASRDIDIGTMVSSAMHLSYERFVEAVNGIAAGYGERIDPTVIGAARLTSTVHALDEYGPERARRAWENGGDLLAERTGDVDAAMAATAETVRERFADARGAPAYDDLPLAVKGVHHAIDRAMGSGRLPGALVTAVGITERLNNAYEGMV